MNITIKQFTAISLFLGLGLSIVSADNLDTIGLTDLRERGINLNGSGIVAAQIEASTSATAEVYQPNPAAAGQANDGVTGPTFSYFDTNNPFPLSGDYNSTQQSGHANNVANGYYDINTGVATNLEEVIVFNANTFANNIILAPFQTDINASVINQSFVFRGLDDANRDAVDQAYDNYADQFSTLFVNGLDNGSNSASPAPATSYNGIAVGREDLNHSTGPTTDGRSKPDIIAPGTAASFATPYVSGSAAILLEAAGTSTDASDPLTVKALLLNGAVKDSNWTHTDTAPLDTRRGAGLLNINRSHLQFQGGQHNATESDDVTAATNYPPSPSALPTGNVSSRLGWNFTTISNANGFLNTTDSIDNYYFDVPADTSTLYDVTATLTWNRQNGESDINNLDLILYDTATGDVVEQSISTVDNVEHIYRRDLASGRYLLQVIKRRSGNVSLSEDYALAFNFAIPAPDAPTDLIATAQAGTDVALTWTDNADDELAYELQRSTLTTSAFTTIETLPANTTSYTDTAPLAETRYTYRVRAVNANGDSFNDSATVTTLSAFESFRFANFGSSTATGDAANDADPDRDGLSNITEYALGTDPTSAAGNDGGASRPSASTILIDGAEFLQLSVSRAQIADGVDYTVEVSDEPGSGWVTATDILENSATELIVRDSIATSDSTRRFIRLRINETAEN